MQKTKSAFHYIVDKPFPLPKAQNYSNFDVHIMSMSLGQYNVYQYQLKISFYPSCDKYHLPNKMVSTVLCRLEKLTVGSIKDRSTIWHYDL